MTCTITESSSDASSAHFPYLRNKGGLQCGDNCDLNGNPSIAVAKIRRRSQPQLACNLLWKLTFRYSPIQGAYLEALATHFSNRRRNRIDLGIENDHGTGVCLDFLDYALMFRKSVCRCTLDL